MKRRKVIARVLDPGQCRYYRAGQEFILGGFTPNRLCDSAYAVLSRDAQAMAYGGCLPWQKNGQVLTRCPDPDGALWKLRLAPGSDSGQDAKRLYGSDALSKVCGDYWEITACRAKEGRCPFALSALADLKKQLEQIVDESAWVSSLRKNFPHGLLPHHRLRVALTACPNACTQPQVRDIGLIARLQPTRIEASCDGCDRCLKACQEGAISVENGRAHLQQDKCVGCGLCVRECSQDAIQAEPLSFRILLGGRLGRHPVWAVELPEAVSPSQVCSVVQRVLHVGASQARPREEFSTVVTRLGIEYLSRATKEASFSDEQSG